MRGLRHDEAEHVLRFAGRDKMFFEIEIYTMPESHEELEVVAQLLEMEGFEVEKGFKGVIMNDKVVSMPSIKVRNRRNRFWRWLVEHLL